MGTTFADVLCELAEALAAYNCGAYTFTRVHHEDDSTIILVFSPPAGTGQPQADPRAPAAGTGGAEPAAAHAPVYLVPSLR
jgi:hypothetical protein